MYTKNTIRNIYDPFFSPNFSARYFFPVHLYFLTIMDYKNACIILKIDVGEVFLHLFKKMEQFHMLLRFLADFFTSIFYHYIHI